jgi:rare lipoprotein A
MKKTITFAVSCLFAAAFCAAQTQGSAFRQEGIASWYGAEFEGRPTASGELFDPNQFTAAHPDLPFGTMLIITNAVNGEKVMVRVNDRGPFVKTRIIDVSRAAAEQLNMLETGTAQVIVELAPRNAVAGAPAGGTNPAAAQASAAGTAAPPEAPADTTPAATTSATGGSATEPGVDAAEASPASTAGTPGSSTGSSQPAATLPANPAAPSYTPQQPALVQSAPAAQAVARPPAQTSAAQSGARVPTQTSAAQTVSPKTTTTPTTTPRTPAQTSTVQPRQSTTSPQTVPSASSSTARPQSGSLPIASYQPIPTTTRPPAATTSPAPVMPSSAMVTAVPSTPPVSTQPQRNQPVYASAEISGGPFVSGRYYRLQVGSYKVAKNAVEVFDRLSAAGLNPQWEPFGDLYRVVISNVRAEDINTIAIRLGNAGFKEAIAREER